MRIDPKDRIVGYPALTIRDLLKKRVFDVGVVEKVLKVDAAEAQRVMNELEKENLVCDLRAADPKRPGAVETTPPGTRLGLASDRAPINRQKAEQIVTEVLRRTEQVNDGDMFLYEIWEIVVYGSYVTGADELNDIDLIVKTRIKGKFEKNYADVLRTRLAMAKALGIKISRQIDWKNQPRLGALNYIAQVSPYVSLAPENAIEKILEDDPDFEYGPPPEPKVIYPSTQGAV